LFLGC